MASRTFFALAVFLSALASTATAQVVRFETTVGDFDMVLNPTHNPLLQGHVDNMLQYVDKETYRGVWINRSEPGFVLQMGGFYAQTLRPPITDASTRPVAGFAPISGAPGIPGLSNTAGTVSLALSSDANGVNHDSGSSSFFVNVGANTNLDADFTVFAAIPDMTTINKIMALPHRDYTQDPNFGGDLGTLAVNNVPLNDDQFQVLIKRAFVLSDGMTVAKDTADVASAVSLSQAAFNSGASAVSVPLLSDTSESVSLEVAAAHVSASGTTAGALATPEPATFALLLVASQVMLMFRRPRSR